MKKKFSKETSTLFKNKTLGTSLAVQWSRLCFANAVGAQFESLFRELRSCMLCVAKKIIYIYIYNFAVDLLNRRLMNREIGSKKN